MVTLLMSPTPWTAFTYLKRRKVQTGLHYLVTLVALVVTFVLPGELLQGLILTTQRIGLLRRLSGALYRTILISFVSLLVRLVLLIALMLDVLKVKL